MNTNIDTNTGTGTSTRTSISTIVSPQTHPITRNFSHRNYTNDKWEKLERLCINDPELFIDLTPCFDVQILTYTKFSGTDSINLFGVAVREKNRALVNHIMSSNQFSEQMLNEQIVDRNPFVYACSTDVEIAFLMLNSYKIKSSLINDVNNLHPFNILIKTECLLPKYSNNVKNLELAMSSERFLKGCSKAQMIKAFYSLLLNVESPRIIRVILDHDVLTSEMIEKMRFCHGSIVEEYCLSECPETLRVLLDSDKITRNFISSIFHKLTYDLYSEPIQNVLDTHVKFTNDEGMNVFEIPYPELKRTRRI